MRVFTPSFAARSAVIAGSLLVAGPAFSAGLILTEANAVGPRKWLNNPDPIIHECATGANSNTEEDVFFGRVLGNGGDWIELAVTTDHLDVRGWKLRWAETDSAPGAADQANGTDIWLGAGNIEQGEITFTQHALWSDLRAGTIITIVEGSTKQGGLNTDTSFNPCGGDWWISINASDAAYLTTQFNVTANSEGCDGPATVPAGTFNTGNDNWEIRIVDAGGATVLGPIGEGWGGNPNGIWAGSGVNSKETIRLSANPTTSPFLYEDSNQSSFGHPNRWSDPAPGQPGNECARYQDYRTLRSWCNCDCARVVLNEYNAVGETIYLNGGTAGADSTGGAAADTHFGRVLGNGGDWFELLITDDHVDLRGAKLAWEEVADATSGVITLTNHAALSNLRAGTVVTFIRNDTASGGLNTDLSYNPVSDRWINICTHDAAFVASTTSTVGSHGFGDFHTSNDNWRLTVRNASDQLLSIVSGEGAAGYGGRGVGNTETCTLEQDPSRNTRSWDLYNESIRSSFGSLNQWRPCPGTTIVAQNLATLHANLCTKQADVNASGAVDVDDLIAVILGWGACVPSLPCTGDVNNSGSVDVDDLIAVILSWG